MTMTIRSNPFEDAFKTLRHTALTGVSSPFYSAALYCVEKELFNEAIVLLKEIPKDHWQFDDAIKLKEDIYTQQISKLQEENLNLRAKLTTLSFQTDNPLLSHQPNNTAASEDLFTNFIKQLNNTSLSSPNDPLNKGPLTFSFPSQTDQKKSTSPAKNERPIPTPKQKLHS